MTRNRQAWLLKQIAEQKRWIEEHGATLSGYIERYGDSESPDKYGDGGVAIYVADCTALYKLECELKGVRA